MNSFLPNASATRKRKRTRNWRGTQHRQSNSIWVGLLGLSNIACGRRVKSKASEQSAYVNASLTDNNDVKTHKIFVFHSASWLTAAHYAHFDVCVCVHSMCVHCPEFIWIFECRLRLTLGICISRSSFASTLAVISSFLPILGILFLNFFQII